MAVGRTVGGDVEQAYVRTDLYERRAELMQAWAAHAIAGKWHTPKPAQSPGRFTGLTGWRNPGHERIDPQPMPAADINPGHYSGIVNAICADLAGGPDPRLSISGAHERLQELAKAEPPDPTLWALSDACAYHFVDEGAESPFAVGCYEPMVVLPKDGGLVVLPDPSGLCRGCGDGRLGRVCS